MAMRIAEIRKAQGRTQAEVAERAGMREATLSDIETGKGNPRLSSLVLIAGALGVSVIDLFEDDGSDPSLTQILREIAALRPEHRATVAQLIQALHQTGPEAA